MHPSRTRLRAAAAVAAAGLGLALVPSAGAATRSSDDACPADLVAAFPDVPRSSVHAAAVDCVVWWGVTQGRTPTTYDPDGVVTRGQMASFLARSADRLGAELPALPQDAFPDDDGSLHEGAVNALAAVGVFGGRAGRALVEEPVSRGQMASFLDRTAALVLGEQLPAGPDAFADDDGSLHEDATNRAAAAGLAAGRSATTFAPLAPVQRDQMASFLSRLLDLGVEGRRGLLHVEVGGLTLPEALPDLALQAEGAPVRPLASGGTFALPDGSYTLTAGPAVAPGVRYDATVEGSPVTVAVGDVDTVTVSYALTTVVLRGEGVGPALLGASESAVRRTLTALLGPPTSDADVCAEIAGEGTWRHIAWRDLSVDLIDAGDGEGRELTGWRVRGDDLPEVLRTPGDLVVGTSTQAQTEAALGPLVYDEGTSEVFGGRWYDADPYTAVFADTADRLEDLSVSPTLCD